MTTKFSEDIVHQYIYDTGLEKLIVNCPEIDSDLEAETVSEDDFCLWKIIKKKALAKIGRAHNLVRYGIFIASKLKLPIDNTVPMELDLIGTHEDGLFILELKVNRSAERNAFSELFAYSNYIAEMFAASGRQDITNVLVARLDVKITRQAFLYDLLIADRNIIVYTPDFFSDKLDSLQLNLYLPSDDDFKAFANELLSHENMACVVASFKDLDGWFDSEENEGSINDWTRDHLGKLSNYTAQLMEAEGLHGFCFIRKPWKEMQSYYQNSIFVCAINPFKLVNPERFEPIVKQITEGKIEELFEAATLGFDGRLIRIAQRAVNDCLTHNHRCEVELPFWESIVKSPQEVVFTHNFAFRPTGMLREAYVSYLDRIYSQNETNTDYKEDVSTLKINEITNWLRAWEFMEACGFKDGEDSDALLDSD